MNNNDDTAAILEAGRKADGFGVMNATIRDINKAGVMHISRGRCGTGWITRCSASLHV